MTHINLSALLNEIKNTAVWNGKTIPLGQVVPNFAMRAFTPIIEDQEDSDIVDNPNGPEEKYQDWAGGVPGIMASVEYDDENELQEIIQEADIAKQFCEDAWHEIIDSVKSSI